MSPSVMYGPGPLFSVEIFLYCHALKVIFYLLEVQTGIRIDNCVVAEVIAVSLL